MYYSYFLPDREPDPHLFAPSPSDLNANHDNYHASEDGLVIAPLMVVKLPSLRLIELPRHMYS